MIACPKTLRIEDKAFLEYVRTLPCLECHIIGENDAHHLLKFPGEFRGTAYKLGDNRVIPMCRIHHNTLHMAGSEIKFFGRKRALFAIDMSIKIWKDWEDNQRR